MVDGIPGEKVYDAIGNTISNSLNNLRSGTFSPDSKSVAYIGIEKISASNKFYIIIDGDEGEAYNSATAIVFSPRALR